MNIQVHKFSYVEKKDLADVAESDLEIENWHWSIQGVPMKTQGSFLEEGEVRETRKCYTAALKKQRATIWGM